MHFIFVICGSSVAPELDDPIPWYEDASIHTSMFFFTTFLLPRERSSDSRLLWRGRSTERAWLAAVIARRRERRTHLKLR